MGPIGSLVVAVFCKAVSASAASFSGGSGNFLTTCSRKNAPCGLAGGWMLRNAGDTSNLTGFSTVWPIADGTRPTRDHATDTIKVTRPIILI